MVVVMKRTKKSVRSSNRSRQLTPKGKELQLNNYIAFMKSSKKRLVKQAALISTLLDGSNRDMVTNELNTLEKTYGEFAENYAHACSILGDTSDADELDEEAQTAVSILMEEVDSKYLAVKENVCSWMINLEKLEAPHKAVKSARILALPGYNLSENLRVNTLENAISYSSSLMILHET